MHVLGIDWGSTNRRAYLMDGAGRCLRRHEDGAGILAEGKHFAASLADLRARMEVPSDTFAVLSGMVGSANGWIEVPYLDTGVPLRQLPRHGVAVDGGIIVPGYCYRGQSVDVMRGEEMQLLGADLLGYGDGWAILPGTHSKWVLLRGGRIERFATYMTGELFAMLGREGSLAGFMEGEADAASFEIGLDQALEGAPLSNALFSVRARVVSGSLDRQAARGVVSGLLVGAEFAAAGRAGGAVVVLGSAALAGYYRQAAGHFGIAVRTIDPDAAYCAALARFREAA